ncbi:hypothetical protein E3N88_33045 [Mikania micrantha]|uniref:Reverse transcriptase Ty1/copia-type domain-containing protein n=1 Tax=Mikania micrantha TaxID=192012 RepID=A0A5N6MA46_9ASTR|nr:hypothetical protein E3N88_33045 [Mikania micrantha]
MIDAKPVSTPLTTNISLTKDGEPFSDPTNYRSIVGALQYLTITCPDIAYAVNQVIQFLQAPTTTHFQEVKRILRNHLDYTPSVELHALPPDRPTLLFASGKLHPQFIPSKLQVADIFTKSLPRPQFEVFRKMLRIGPSPDDLSLRQVEVSQDLMQGYTYNMSSEQMYQPTTFIVGRGSVAIVSFSCSAR